MNVIFSAANLYYFGVGFHLLMLLFQTSIFLLDVYFRHSDNKKAKKVSEKTFKVVYYVSAYVIMMVFLIEVCSLIMVKTSNYNEFP